MPSILIDLLPAHFRPYRTRNTVRCIGRVATVLCGERMCYAPGPAQRVLTHACPQVCINCANSLVNFVLAAALAVLVVLFFAGYGLLLLRVKGAVVFKWEVHRAALRPRYSRATATLQPQAAPPRYTAALQPRYSHKLPRRATAALQPHALASFLPPRSLYPPSHSMRTPF